MTVTATFLLGVGKLTSSGEHATVSVHDHSMTSLLDALIVLITFLLYQSLIESTRPEELEKASPELVVMRRLAEFLTRLSSSHVPTNIVSAPTRSKRQGRLGLDFDPTTVLY